MTEKRSELINLGVGVPERCRKPSGAEIVRLDDYIARLQALCDRVDALIEQVRRCDDR